MAVSSIEARLVLSKWDACPALVPRKMQCPEEEEEEEVTDCEPDTPLALRASYLEYISASASK